MKTYRYNNETFELDDSNACYIKVTHKDQVGFVGTNLQDKSKVPSTFCWTMSPTHVTQAGLTGGNGHVGQSFEFHLQVLCGTLIIKQREEDARRNSFDAEKACADIRGFMEQLA